MNINFDIDDTLVPTIQSYLLSLGSNSGDLKNSKDFPTLLKNYLILVAKDNLRTAIVNTTDQTIRQNVKTFEDNFDAQHPLDTGK